MADVFETIDFSGVPGFEATDAPATPEPAVETSAPADEMDAALAEVDAALGEKPTDPAKPGDPAPDDKGIERQADGSLKFPDGSVVTEKDIRAFLGITDAPAATETAKPAVDPTFAAMQKEIETLKAALAPKPEPEKDLVNPITEGEEWMQGWAHMQAQRGVQVTREQAREMLGEAREQWRNKAFQQLESRMNGILQEKNVAQEAARIQGEVQKVESTGKYPLATTEGGKEYVQMVLQRNAAKGEHNVEKAYQETQAFLAKWAMEAFVKPKQEKAKQVLRSIPRGGGTKPTPQPDYGSDIGVFERLTESLTSKGG